MPEAIPDPTTQPAPGAAGQRATGENGGRRAGGMARPRPIAAPPPDPAEALYYEGMAAYQHRDWRTALAKFTRLQELQPNRPGLQALLDEVTWFLQLETAAPAPDAEPAAPAGDLRPKSSTPSKTARLRAWAIVLVGVIGVAALILTALGGRLPWRDEASREAQDLYNRGQARLTAGDYEGAQAAFRKLLDITPADPEARLGLTRAERQQILAQGYAAAEAAIAAEEWDAAAAELQKILALDGTYADAQARADFVARRQRLAAIYNDGSRLYDLGQWENAIAQFEKIRSLDNTYRYEAVAEFLFVCYLNASESLMERADGQVPVAQKAVEYASSALAIHPRNRPAADARRQGALYLDAMRAQANGNPADTQARLEALLAEAPGYANGAAARQLYELLLRRAEAALAGGDIAGAIRFYRSAQTAPVTDHTAAAAGEALARSITPTPIPSPTPQPTATPPPATPAPYVLARAAPLNIRSGPGGAYAIIAQAGAADRLTVTGRSADGAWWRICTGPADAPRPCVESQEGWVAEGLVLLQGNADALPIIAAATATPPPLPTAVRVTCVTGQVRDAAGGAPLAGWTITLGEDGAALTQRSDAGGFYRFANLPSGTYRVAEQLEPGWRAVSPASAGLTLTPASACVTLDFWNERAGGAPGPTAPPPSPTPPR